MKKDKNNNIIFLISSSISAIFNKTSIAPLERLKILQQSDLYYKYNNYNKSIFNSFKYIYKNEGFKGFYKGNLINIYRVLPSYLIKFPLNEIGYKYIKKYNNLYKKTDKISYLNKLNVGIFVGTIQITLTYPFDFLRTRLSLDKTMFNMYKNNIITYTKHIIKTEGILNLYKGYKSCIITYPLYVGLQFSIFNECRENNINVFLSGSLAGLIAQSLVFPGDVIKRQMQLNGINNQQILYNSILDCIKKIYKNEGIYGFYTGLKINLIKCIPGASIQFATYEYCKNLGIKYFN